MGVLYFAEVKSNLPGYQHPQLLSVSKAAHLQGMASKDSPMPVALSLAPPSNAGFVSGLCSATSLPESFQRGVPSPLRAGVQGQYRCLDPYSPLALVVPQGMPPPWRDCFVEGQRDIVHGGSLSKALVQNARLKQCSRQVLLLLLLLLLLFTFVLLSRCRSWSLASEKLSIEQSTTTTTSSSPSQAAVQQWRSAWSNSCFCAAPWTLKTNKTIL